MASLFGKRSWLDLSITETEIVNKPGRWLKDKKFKEKPKKTTRREGLWPGVEAAWWSDPAFRNPAFGQKRWRPEQIPEPTPGPIPEHEPDPRRWVTVTLDSSRPVWNVAAEWAAENKGEYPGQPPLHAHVCRFLGNIYDLGGREARIVQCHFQMDMPLFAVTFRTDLGPSDTDLYGTIQPVLVRYDDLFGDGAWQSRVFGTPPV